MLASSLDEAEVGLVGVLFVGVTDVGVELEARRVLAVGVGGFIGVFLIIVFDVGVDLEARGVLAVGAPCLVGVLNVCVFDVGVELEARVTAVGGLVGVLFVGVFDGGVDLEDRDILFIGVCGLEAGLVALASLSLLVLVGRGTIFILLILVLGAGVEEAICAAPLTAGLDSGALDDAGCTLRLGKLILLGVAGRVEALAASPTSGLSFSREALVGLFVLVVSGATLVGLVEGATLD